MPQFSRLYLNRPHTWPGWLLVCCLGILGIILYRDYGICWDEPGMRNIGHVNLEFIRSGDRSLFSNFGDIDHGAAFEVPLKWAEEALNIKTPAGIHYFRNLACFLFYAAGIWCGYRLALQLFRRQWLALLAAAMLVLQPRIFAHAFFNSKDVPFMSATLIALWVTAVAIDRRKWWLLALAGLAWGYATGIRLMSVLPALMAALLLCLDIFYQKEKGVRYRQFSFLLLFSLAGVAGLYASWPVLWGNPIDELRHAIESMSQYGWGGWLIFNGRGYQGAKLPWYYVPEWISISTPVLWVLLFFAGAIAGALQIFRNRGIPWRTTRQKILLICAVTAICPLLLVIGLHSTLYDDWRHLYFIYPAIVMIAVYGAEKLSVNASAKKILATLCIVEIVLTTITMVRFHPYEQVYFNELVPTAPEWRRHHFDYEYWGTSFGDALRWLLAHDRRDSIRVVVYVPPVELNADLLPDTLRRRISLTMNGLEQNAYLLTNYRNQRADVAYPLIHDIRRGGSSVSTIYRVDTTIQAPPDVWRVVLPQ